MRRVTTKQKENKKEKTELKNMKNHRTRTRTSLVVVVKAVAKVGDAHAKRTKNMCSSTCGCTNFADYTGQELLLAYKTSSLPSDPKIVKNKPSFFIQTSVP